ncbi:M10 family metallopeptidase [Limimaricola cinnabarinus]|nr:M10 family metallopeptidase [Limimaricola cinnabarinus]
MPSYGTAAQFADYLKTGYHRDVGQTPYFFSPKDASLITFDLSGLSDSGKTLARWAMSTWESVLDVSFQEKTGGAKLNFTDHASGAWAKTEYWSDGTINKATVNVSTDWVERYGTSVDSYSYRTYLHEIGHVMGLGHSANYGSDSAAHYDNDSWQMSVMSYVGQDENPYVTASRAVNVTPMEADLIALKALYGASDKDITAGNTIWGRNSNLDTPLGEMFRAMEHANSGSYKGGEGFTFYLEDEDGWDLVDFAHDAKAQTIDLRGGQASSLVGEAENMLIARDTVIEQYRAGSGDDVVGGNGVGNRIWGNDGDDRLAGRGGNDNLAGGHGNDVIFGNWHSDRLFGGNGQDKLFGGQGNDKLYGQWGKDFIKGGHGNDLIYGNMHADRLYGEGGWDRISGGNGNDRLYGQGGNDVLRGDGGADLLFGNWHSDRLYGGSGNDGLFGGNGIDRLYGQGGSDLLKGGHGRDLLAGGWHSDRLYGEGGDDRLVGQAGHDLLAGGAGNDVLTGGWGSDCFVFEAGTDRITDHTSGVDLIQFDLSGIDRAQGMTLDQLRGLAREVDGDVEFDFGSGHRLIVENQTPANLISDLEIL